MKSINVGDNFDALFLDGVGKNVANFRILSPTAENGRKSFSKLKLFGFFNQICDPPILAYLRCISWLYLFVFRTEYGISNSYLISMLIS